MDPLPPSDTSPSGSLTKPRSTRHVSLLNGLLRYFSPGERLLLYVFTVVLGMSSFALLVQANAAISVVVPSHGGTLVEGEVGPVRFVNPLLALSQADEDVSALVYSGLMRALPDGSLVPDLAKEYRISEDGLTYVFTLKDDVTFHDGTRVTSADVLFTIKKAQDPEIKSSHRAEWEGVTVSAPDPATIQFTLPRAYAPFLQNTTIGILPEHLWGRVSALEFPFHPLNTNPVGSGPYRVHRSHTDATGAVTSYELRSFKEYSLGQPFLSRITFRFYPNERALIEALNTRRIDSVAGISPENLSDITRNDLQIITAPLPRTFGVFFNQNRSPVFTDIAVRRALDEALDKDALVRRTLAGYGVPLSGPVPPGLISPSDQTPVERGPSHARAFTEDTLRAAREVLENGGWQYDESTARWTKGSRELSFTLATAETSALKTVAEQIAEAWGALGVHVTLSTHPIAELNANVIRPREYDAVLFGEVVGRELDLFAFWHSSQRTDPGLNLALYTNARADAILSQARGATDPTARAALYREFETIVAEDRPAVFLFSPEFIYVVPESLSGVSLAPLTFPGERFASVHQWYTDTEYVWHFFVSESDATL